MLTPDSEELLIRRAIAGDEKALSALLRQHGPAIERTLQIVPKWRALLEPGDVMQVTYLEVFQQIRRFDFAKGQSFAPWLRRMAENNLRDAIRGLERQKHPQPENRVQPRAGEDSIVGLYDLLGVTTTTPSRVFRRAEQTRLLDESLDKLPKDYAQVVRLYDLEGRTIDEVAASLGRTPGAVHMLRARAHERLRTELGAATQLFLTSSG